MGTYRKEWDCCDSVTETQSWEPDVCPFCTATPSAEQDPPPTGFESWKDAALSERVRRVKAEKSLASAENRPAQDDVRDAQRYRWLRTQQAQRADDYDKAVDDAIAKYEKQIASQSAKEPR